MPRTGHGCLTKTSPPEGADSYELGYFNALRTGAMALMVDYRIRTIPVVNDAAGGKVVVGVVTRRDLTAALEAENGNE